mmetsp:Transcript_31828/g.56180  ORF Transcript_31828/g.56180 Transcript_31828/m.56180 type:complete len:271 (+) Transcript_31828:98-910(+)
MALVGVEVDQFVIILFKSNEADKMGALDFINRVEDSIRDWEGNIQLRTDKPKDWEIFDGKDHFREPNHLNPAIFDLNCIMVAGFRSTIDVHAWWNSDQVFSLLKYRSSIDKMGVFIVEGLQSSYDVIDEKRVAFGERLVLLELINMEAFKPVQQYVDNYRLFSERALTEIGMDCNLFFAEAISGVLMNEYPLDACCASSWRMRSDAQFWYDSDYYTTQLLPLRQDFSRSFTILVPMVDERMPWETKKKLANQIKNKEATVEKIQLTLKNK